MLYLVLGLALFDVSNLGYISLGSMLAGGLTFLVLYRESDRTKDENRILIGYSLLSLIFLPFRVIENNTNEKLNRLAYTVVILNFFVGINRAYYANYKT